MNTVGAIQNFGYEIFSLKITLVKDLSDYTKKVKDRLKLKVNTVCSFTG